MIGFRTRVVAGAIATATVAGCGLSLSVALLSVRLDAAGFSARAIGLNSAAGGVATLVWAPFIPAVARRCGIAQLLMASLAVGGAAMLAFTQTAIFGVWLALQLVIGAAATVLFVVSEYWIGATTVAGRRGLAIGLYATSLSLGFALGPALLALVGTRGDGPFFLGAGLFWAAAIPLSFNMAGAPELVGRSGKGFWVVAREAPMAMLAACLHGATEAAGIGLLPVYALRSGVEAEGAALFAGMFVLGGVVLQVPLGLLSDRVDRRILLAGVVGLGLLGTLLLATVGTTQRPLFEAALLVWGGIVGGLYPLGLAQLGARYAGDELAGANAAFVMAYALGMLVGPPLVGLGLDLAPPQGFFLALAGLFAPTLLVSAWNPATTRWRRVRVAPGAGET